MALLKTVSGTRGTLGGQQGDNLTAFDVVETAAAYGQWLLESGNKPLVLVGRDGRISGPVIQPLVMNTLMMLGIDIIDCDLTTTPTIEMAVTKENAGGGIILTASHNPGNWNALKLLNEKGEFLSALDGERILEIAKNAKINFADADKLGKVISKTDYIPYHIEQIFCLPILNIDKIKEKRYKVVVDAINSTGALAMPLLLEKLGCEVIVINGEINGEFAHNPEPLMKNLIGLSNAVKENNADVGIAVDPDVDRLALMCEDGTMFGEEYTLVAAADLVLKNKVGNTVSNLSSTMALRDVTNKAGGKYFSSKVGEVHVVEKMKSVSAVIGGEGNGGVIYPELHYGRDALVGIAMILSLFSEENISLSALRDSYPKYVIEKQKLELPDRSVLSRVFKKIEEKYSHCELNKIDGIRIQVNPHEWLHIRGSNTEPIVRIYGESGSADSAAQLVNEVKDYITKMLN